MFSGSLVGCLYIDIRVGVKRGGGALGEKKGGNRRGSKLGGRSGLVGLFGGLDMSARGRGSNQECV